MFDGFIDFEFSPNPQRARALDRRMHVELGQSLQHICEASRGVLEFNETGMSDLVARLLLGGPVEPQAFARYYELVLAISDENETDAVRLFRELAARRPAKSHLQISALGEGGLGEDNERFMRMMGDGSGAELGFVPPAPDIANAFRGRLAQGLALLDSEIPELAGEIRAIIRHIIIVGSDPAKKYQVDGGSHFQLWGALFLNGNYHPDRIAVAEVLAHECAHSLLFGFCTDEALVDNDDDELFSSPLRVDKRPMDGIYHATFVSARMHWAMTRLAANTNLMQEERDRAAKAAASDLVNFDAGYRVVAEHGRLTSVGSSLISAAKAHIDASR